MSETFARLVVAVERRRTIRYCLRRWSDFVKQRDDHRCVVCRSTSGLSAHHIVRRSFIPQMQLEPGNGITLCPECHREPHRAFNRRPDLKLPMDSQGGDKCDLITGFFGALVDDAQRRRILSDDYYYLSDAALRTFKKFQGISPNVRFPGHRIEQARLIWQQTPRPLLERLLCANDLRVPPGLVQTRGTSTFRTEADDVSVFMLT